MAVFTAIGAAIFGAGTFAALATAAALQVAAGIAVNLIAQSVSGKNSDKPGFGVQGRLQAGGTLPRSIMFGYGATAGSLVYANTWGAANQADNAYLTQVICLSDYPVSGLAQVWVNGELVTLDAALHASYGYPVVEYSKDGVDHLWVKFYDGTQTTADAFLADTVASVERPYASTRVGVGCAYAIVTARVNETLFTGFPQFKFALNGAKLYDPSKDTTAGGVGVQRWADPSTWGGDGDHLPVVQMYNLLRGVTYGGAWLYGLQNLPSARLPNAHWIAQIEKCRATVTGPQGAEATYRSGGEITVGAPIADALEAILTTCQGRLAEIGGVYKVHVGEPGASVFSFSDDDIISTDEQTFTPFFGLADTINGISASHPSPAEGWNQKVAPPLYNASYEALDGNRRLMADVSLDLVPYPGQVQRLMKSSLAEARRARRHTFVLPPEAFALEPGDIIDWTSDRNGYAVKLFRVDGIVDRGDLDVMVDITEVDPVDYDWDQATDYTAPVDGPVTRVLPAPQPMVAWSVVGEAVLDDDGVERRPSIRISWDGDQPDVRAVAYQVRLASTGVVVTSGEILDVAASTAPLPPVFLPNTAYEVRGKYVPVSNRDTEWSSWLAVTTPDVKLGARDISIELADIAADVVQQLDWVKGGLRQALEGFKRLGTILEEESLANYNLRQVLARQIAVEMGDLRASFDEVIETAIGPGGAIATALSSLYAAMGGSTAEVLVRWEAVATPAGVAARWALQLSVDGAAFASAGIYLEVSDLGVSRIVLDAGQTVITTDGGGTVAALFAAGTTTIAKARIGDASIETAKIADLAVTAGKIDDLAVTSAKIAGAAITEAKIANAAITNAKIGTLAVDTINLAEGAVTVTISTTLSDDTNFQYVESPRNATVTLSSYVSGVVQVVVQGNGHVPATGTPGELLAVAHRKNNATGVEVEIGRARIQSGSGGAVDAPLNISRLDIPTAAGSYTYRLEMWTNITATSSYSGMILLVSYAKK